MRNRILTLKEIQYIIRRYHILIDPFSVDELGRLNVNGDVKISDTKLKKLPLKFGKVSGNFHCHLNRLTTLQGVPYSVGGDFNCSNNKLKSLKHASKLVGGDFFCQENTLEKLNGVPTIINGNFNCFLNNLKNLKNGPTKVKKSYYAYGNQLTSLEGSPLLVGKSFHVVDNQLLNLIGLPRYIGELFSFDRSTNSINLGSNNCNVKKIEIQDQLGENNKNKILPRIIFENQKSLPIIFKYFSYLELYNEAEILNIENLNCILKEINDGLQ